MSHILYLTCVEIANTTLSLHHCRNPILTVKLQGSLASPPILTDAIVTFPSLTSQSSANKSSSQSKSNRFLLGINPPLLLPLLFASLLLPRNLPKRMPILHFPVVEAHPFLMTRIRSLISDVATFFSVFQSF